MMWLSVAIPALGFAPAPTHAAPVKWRPADWDERHAAAREYVEAVRAAWPVRPRPPPVDPGSLLLRPYSEEIAVCAVSGAPIWYHDEWLEDPQSCEYFLRQAVGLPLNLPSDEGAELRFADMMKAV